MRGPVIMPMVEGDSAAARRKRRNDERNVGSVGKGSLGGAQRKKGRDKRRKLGQRFKGKSNRLLRLTNVTLVWLEERREERRKEKEKEVGLTSRESRAGHKDPR